MFDYRRVNMPIVFPLFSQYIYGCFEDFQPLGGFKFDNGWDQQMSYTWASDRWVMPAPYYKTSVVYADLGFDVDYYFLDSNFVDAKPPEDEFSFFLHIYICLYREHSPIQWVSRAKSYTWIETSSMIEVIISQTRFSFAHAHTHYSPICMFRGFSAQCTSSVPSS